MTTNRNILARLTGQTNTLCTLILLFLVVTSFAQAQNWVKAGGSPPTVPADAIVGGQDIFLLPVYVCRGGVSEGIGLQVGYYQTEGINIAKGCLIAFGGQVFNVPDFEFLVASWKSINMTTLPFLNPVVGGNEADPNPDPGGFRNPGPSLFYCRSNIDGHFQVGKVRTGFPGCLIPFGGREVVATTFDVLVNESPTMPLTQPSAQSGAVPADTIHGGTDLDGNPLYLCASGFLDGGIHPGKLNPSLNACHFGWGGVEQSSKFYNTVALGWTTFGSSQIHISFDFAVGYDVNGSSLHICRARSQFGILPGKTRSDWKTCHFAFNEQEQESSDYDVLSSNTPIIK